MNTLSSWLIELSPHVAIFTTVLFLVKATTLLSVAWCAHFALRRVNPRWRVLLWRSTGVGMVLLVALSVCPPLLAWGVLPLPVDEQTVGQDLSWQAPPSAASPREVPTSTAALKPIPVEGTLPGQVLAYDVERPSVNRSQGHEFRTVRRRDHQAAQPAVETVATAPVRVPVANEEVMPETVQATVPRATTFRFPWVVGFWLVGLLAVLLRTLDGLRRVRAIVRRAEPVPDWVWRQAVSVKDQLRCKRWIELRQTPEVGTPCLVGLRRPIVLLPTEQTGPARREELPAILMHEMAHLKAHDLPWNAVLHCLTTLFWFHPLAWRIRLAHAGSCDAVADTIAADKIGDVGGYIRTLARLAVQMHDPAPGSALAMARTSSVRQRIQDLQRKLFSAALPRGRMLTVLAAGAITVGLLGSIAITQAEAELKETAKVEAEDEKKAESEGTPEAKSTDADTEEPTSIMSILSAALPGSDEPKKEQRTFTIHATDAESGEPLAGIKTHFYGRVDDEKHSGRRETSAKGIVTDTWDADGEIGYYRFTCEKDGYVPIHYSWSSGGRAKIEMPDSVQLQFHRGQQIGGVVQDKEGRPIKGARVEGHMPIDWPKTNSIVFTVFEQVTDADGRWQWNGAPKDIQRVRAHATHGDYLYERITPVSGLGSVCVIQKGSQVTGRILDTAGKPIHGATALFGFDRISFQGKKAYADEEGRFALKSAEPGKSMVTVQAIGYSPESRTIEIDGATDAGEFRLEPGHTLRFRVVDSDGKPLEGVGWAPGKWRGYRVLDARSSGAGSWSETDADGRSQWESAPPDEVLYSFFKRGHMSLRDYPLRASEKEHVLTMSRSMIIRGKVTDAVTGRPIPSFTLCPGYLWTSRTSPHWSEREATPLKGGEYETMFDEPLDGQRLLQVRAPGYLPASSRSFELTEGEITIDFQLHVGTGLSGVVLGPTGEPVAGSQVGLGAVEDEFRLENGHFGRGFATEVVTTDAAGQFVFTPREKEGEDKPYLIVAVDDLGFAQAVSQKESESPQLRLTPWGRIEGQVFLGDNPDVNRKVMYLGKNAREDDVFLRSWVSEATTDAEGRFTMDRVKPGAGSAVRIVVKESFRSFRQTPGWQTPLEVRSGETTSITIGGTGRKVVGRIRLAREPDIAVDWLACESVRVFLQDPAFGGTHPTYFSCVANLDKTGHFEIPDVPAGAYELGVKLNNPPTPNRCGLGDEIGSARHLFIIPPISEEQKEEPLDLGAIPAELFDTLDVGEEAPDFTAENLSGGEVRMEEHRGKFVLLDFWATWCAPCMAQLSELEEIHEQFGDDPRFVLLSVSCDSKIQTARDEVEKRGLDWPHGYVSGRYAATLKDYTVRALPATFLIGPDGRVIARDLRGGELKEAVAKALGSAE